MIRAEVRVHYNRGIRCAASVTCIAVMLVSGCAFPNASLNRYPPQSFSNPELRAKFEEEFSSRPLDPIEGFWQSSNEFGEGTGVCYRTDPSVNGGFAFAVRGLEAKQKVWLPHRPAFNAVGCRFNATGNPAIYKGQVLMSRGGSTFWMDASLTLISPTTVEVTVNSHEEVMGGKTQRSYLVGPKHVLEQRLRQSQGSSLNSNRLALSVSDCEIAKLAPKPEADRESLALIDFDADSSLGTRTGLALADIAREAVLDSNQFLLVDRENMLTILGEEDLAAAIKCDQARCLVQYGKKLRAQKIFHGRVSKVGETFVLRFGITDCGTAETVAIRTSKVTGSVDQLIDVVRPMVCDIVRELQKRK